MTGKMNETKSDRVDKWLSLSIIFFFIIQSVNSSIKTVFPALNDTANSYFHFFCAPFFCLKTQKQKFQHMEML